MVDRRIFTRENKASIRGRKQTDGSAQLASSSGFFSLLTVNDLAPFYLPFDM
jgi:hypothetical protein